MKAYPGRAKKFEPSDEFPAGQFFSGLARAPRFPPAQGKRTHTIELTMVQLPEDDELQSRLSKFDVIEAFGAETSNLFNIGFQSYPRKKFARKLSNQSRAESCGAGGRLAGVHSAGPAGGARSHSVDSRPAPALSRRQILAGLAGREDQSTFSRASLLLSLSRQEAAARLDRLDSSGETIDSEEEEVEDGEAWTGEAGAVSLVGLTWVATLGVGGFGRVELVTHNQSGRTFALKKMKKSQIRDTKQQQHILNEKKIMQQCNNPFIVELYKTFKDNKYLYMLMEPCLGGELWTVLRKQKRFQDDTAKFYVGCVILAFDYLHSQGVIYRDLKPENLLLDSHGYVKLTDFGFSRWLTGEERAWTFCGTPEYVAPEIITAKSHDQRADLWSLGILVFELLTGAPPFTNKANPAQIYPAILKGLRSVYFPHYVTGAACEVIRQCCRLAPAQRPGLATLKHFIWFAGQDWARLAERSLSPPRLPHLDSQTDCSNFDTYALDTSEPEDDFSDWAEDF